MYTISYHVNIYKIARKCTWIWLQWQNSLLIIIKQLYQSVEQQFWWLTAKLSNILWLMNFIYGSLSLWHYKHTLVLTSHNVVIMHDWEQSENHLHFIIVHHKRLQVSCTRLQNYVIGACSLTLTNSPVFGPPCRQWCYLPNLYWMHVNIVTEISRGETTWEVGRFEPPVHLPSGPPMGFVPQTGETP